MRIKKEYHVGHQKEYHAEATIPEDKEYRLKFMLKAWGFPVIGIFVCHCIVSLCGTRSPDIGDTLLSFIPCFFTVYLGFYIFLGIGTMLVLTALYEKKQSDISSLYWVFVDGTITSITSVLVEKKQRTWKKHTVLVSYTYNGVTYDNVDLGRYDSGMQEGDHVKLTIDSRNPCVPAFSSAWQIWMGLGVFCIVLPSLPMLLMLVDIT